MNERIKEHKSIYDLSSISKSFPRKRLTNSEKTTIRTKSLYDASSGLKKKLKKKCSCGKEGTKRVDNGLKAGIHCDKCWEKLILDCRSRSY